MPSQDTKNFAKTRAYQLAGRTVWFSETKNSQKRVGRVVGYYYEMGQVVLECDSEVEYAVDPMMGHLLPVAQLRRGAKYRYVCVDVYLIDAELRQKTPQYPHDCPRCRAPALVFFRTIECSNFNCPCYKSP